MSSPPPYVLGHNELEIARLDAQARSLVPATDLLLRAAGVAPGMRLLDLGTGLGHVALQVAELVGAERSVIGTDKDETLLEVAEQRRLDAGAENVAFVAADVRTFQSSVSFDAVVGRLVLFHLPDAVEVLQHHLEALRPGGLLVALDFDVGSARAEPPLRLIATLTGWISTAFRLAGANPAIGARLELLLRAAGLEAVESFGVQDYVGPHDPRGPALLAGVVRSLAEPILAAGIATETELSLDTLQQRLTRDPAAANATLLPPTLVGAWGRHGGSVRGVP
jgi:SAM-dependent methyltransferase